MLLKSAILLAPGRRRESPLLQHLDVRLLHVTDLVCSLDEGIVVYVEGRTGKREDYSAKDGKTNIETVVLVNENSASAAEILAAALQDNGYELVGKTTFGKGVIQSTAELKDGSALKWTIMQYFSPKGNVINKKGVTPDHEVDIPENGEKDTQLEKAKELLK